MSTTDPAPGDEHPGVSDRPLWRRYLRFFGADPDADVDDELRTHVELRIDENVARGMSLEEARREAEIRFGDLERVRAECRAIGHQQEQRMRRVELFGSLGQDLRYAVRTLLRAPAFAAVAILSLALGIGANTAIFGLVDSLVLRPLPGIADPHELVELEGESISYPSFRAAREQVDVFADVAAYRTREISISSGDRVRVASVGIVSANYFDVLGTRAILGRTFAPDEGRPGAPVPVAVLSHGTWATRFAGDSAVLGQTIRLNGAQFTIVGVAPRGFRGTRVALAPELWIPIEAWPLTAVGSLATLDIERPGWSWLMAVARLRPGVDAALAEQRVRAFGERRDAQRLEPGWELASVRVTPSSTAAASVGGGPGGAEFSLLLLGVVGLTLLIACANVAGLLLARASRRRREISVRLAIGASRWRLVRQLLTESIVIAVAGAAVGVLLAMLVVPRLASVSIPGMGDLVLMQGEVTVRMLGFTALLAIGSVLVFGLVPALQASRPALVPALKDGGDSPGGARTRLRSSLIVAQLALSLVLLAAAGLFVRSLREATGADTGYETHRLAVAVANVGYQRYGAARSIDFYASLRDRLVRRPDVTSVSWAVNMPLTGNREVLVFFIRSPAADTAQRVNLAINLVGPDYLRTLGIPLVLGRDISDRDDARSPAVAVVNETMARRYWPGGHALGARVWIGDEVEVTIVGVARDARYVTLDEEPAPHLYLAAAQSPQGLVDDVVVFARAAGAPAPLVPVLIDEIRAMDAGVPVLHAAPFDDVLGQLLLPQRASAAMLGLFGTLTLFLAAVGVYGIMAFLVAQRTRELGIRMALGASRASVLRLVLGRSAALILIGVAAGLALAFGAGQLLARFLFRTGPADPWAFAGSALLLGGTALAASYIPARRAMRIEPTVALKGE